MKWRNCKDWWSWWNWDEFLIGLLLIMAVTLFGYLVQLRYLGGW